MRLHRAITNFTEIQALDLPPRCETHSQGVRLESSGRVYSIIVGGVSFIEGGWAILWGGGGVVSYSGVHEVFLGVILKGILYLLGV